MNLDITDSMGPGTVRHMQNPSYTYDEYLVCIGLGPSISCVICKNLSYSGPSYPSSPVYLIFQNLLHLLFSITYCVYYFSEDEDELDEEDEEDVGEEDEEEEEVVSRNNKCPNVQTLL